MITLTECATASCTSRAIRVRSETTAACSLRSRSASRAAASRVSSAARSPFTRLSTPRPQPGSRMAGWKIASQTDWPASSEVTTPAAIAAASTMSDRRRGSRQPAQAVIPIRPISPAPPMSDAPTSSPSGKQATATSEPATGNARGQHDPGAEQQPRAPDGGGARDEHRVQMSLGDREQADERAQDERAQPMAVGAHGEFHDRIVRKPPGTPSPPNDGPLPAGDLPVPRTGSVRGGGRDRAGAGGRVPVMTNTITPSVSITTSADTGAAKTRTFLYRLAGGLLVAGPVLTFAGMLTSPHQDGGSTADYVTSLARDGLQTQVSALFLHYSNLLTGVGLLVVPLLVRGTRGRILTLIGTLAAVLTMLNISGAVKDDWWRMEIGRTLPLDVAIRISDAVDASALLSPWRDVSMIGFLGLLLLYIGLARAGVLGWWATAVYAVALVGMFTVPVSMTLVYGLVFTALFAPLAVVGVRAIRRTHR